ncbi:MAG: pyruvate, phosphate dikinase, partial [Hyphomonadaceae bacterium]|nr:pyruvate, phosphate dikinase [Hyphomonadaceae bacterium]
VIYGAAQMVQPELTGDFGTLMGWADKARRMKVRANAETPLDAETAVKFGAEGIGLCRTEHMFFDAERIAAVREMILAEKSAARVAALEKLFPHQRKDFVQIFKAMGARPVTIRFLDPPLHEFLPHTEEECADVAKATGLDAKALLARAKELAESNPMLGFRGCRLAIVYPEIYDMQARAVFEAACDVAEQGAAPTPEIMIPFVIAKKEFETLKARVDTVAQEVFAKRGRAVDYLVGTMIELPRAALKAGEIAEAAEFFSFGTNDLTQTAMGLSRDDAGKFLGAYVEKAMLERDPFVSIDEEGVGELVRLASERGRRARPALKLGICGEHGGDPASVFFFERAGLDYVSCSPYRVPIARLAAAQAALSKK